jgi:hypothetical protein
VVLEEPLQAPHHAVHVRARPRINTEQVPAEAVGHRQRVAHLEHLNNPQRRSLRAIQGRAVSSGVSGRELRDAVEGLGVAIRRT